MEVLYRSCCGIDVHKQFLVACLLFVDEKGQPSKELRRSGGAQFAQTLCEATKTLANLEVPVENEDDRRGFRLLYAPEVRVTRVSRIASIAVGRMATRSHRSSSQRLLTTSAHPFRNQRSFVLGHCAPNV